MIFDLDRLRDEFPPELNKEEIKKIEEYKELEKILPYAKNQSEILEKLLREKVLPAILEKKRIVFVVKNGRENQKRRRL